MLTVIFSLIFYTYDLLMPSWVEKTIFISVLIIDLVLETCGLIALYNLFTRL